MEELAKIYATSELYRKMAPALAKRFAGSTGRLLRGPRRVRSPLHGGRAAAAAGRLGSGLRGVLLDGRPLLRIPGRNAGRGDESGGPPTVTLVVSDHGFKVAGERPRTSGRADIEMAPLWHRLYGVIFVDGKEVKAGPISGAWVLDVAPTALALLGAPISKELPGHPLAERSRRRARQGRAVERYPERPKRAAPPLAEADTEAMQKLAALGYLAGAGAGARKRIAHDGEGRTASSYLERGLGPRGIGRRGRGPQSFAKAVQLDPDNASALVYAARIYTQRGELQRAGELLDRALQLKPADSAVRLQRAAWALATGDLPKAGAELDAAARLDDRLPLYHILRARLADTARHSDVALAALAEAERLTDADGFLAEVYMQRAEINAELGRVPTRRRPRAGVQARTRAAARQRARAHRDGAARSRRRGALFPDRDRRQAEGLVPGGGARQGARRAAPLERGRGGVPARPDQGGDHGGKRAGVRRPRDVLPARAQRAPRVRSASRGHRRGADVGLALGDAGRRSWASRAGGGHRGLREVDRGAAYGSRLQDPGGAPLRGQARPGERTALLKQSLAMQPGQRDVEAFTQAGRESLSPRGLIGRDAGIRTREAARTPPYLSI